MSKEASDGPMVNKLADFHNYFIFRGTFVASSDVRSEGETASSALPILRVPTQRNLPGREQNTRRRKNGENRERRNLEPRASIQVTRLR